MNVLLDAHILLWWASGRGSRLTPRALELIRDGETGVLIGAGSLYEIAVKAHLGRLDLPSRPERYLPRTLRRHAFAVLAIDESHVLRAAALPFIHRDPWDRLLIAQSQIEDAPIVTADPLIGQYDVQVIW